MDGQSWTSGTGAIVAAPTGTPLSIAAAYNGHKAVDFDGTACFVVPTGSNPVTGATALTMVAVFEPTINGASGGAWWQSSGLIGMEQSGSVADWGFGWNGNQTNGGMGGPDITMFSPAQETNRLQVAMLTWGGGVQKLYVNGVLVDSDTGIQTAARNAGAFGLGAITGNGDNKFTGRIAELRIYNSDETANATSIFTTLRDKYFSDVLLTSAKLSTTGGTIVLTDTAAAKVNAAGTFTLLLNGDPVTAVPNKVGDVTTLTFTTTLEPNNIYVYDLTIPRLAGGDQSMSGSLNSYKQPLTLAGLAGAAGSWGIREYTRPGTANVAQAADAATAATDPFIEATAPVFNHADPDSNGATSTGNFNNDFNILTNTAANDDFVVVGKTKVTVPAAGDYTFSVHGDDGFVMRVAGGRFTSAAGSGQIDPGDSQSIFLDGGTGDSNTRGTYHFDAAGTYDVTYLGWDGGGGGYYEVAWAAGTFVNDRDTNTWALVGNPSDPSIPAFRDRVTQTIPGPAGTNGAFGTRTYKSTGTMNNLGDANNFITSTVRTPADPDGLTIDTQLPYLNHRDPQDGGPGGLIPGDLPFPGDTAANDDTVLTTAKARIVIPTTGTYTFAYAGDDGFLLRFKGVGGNPNPKFKQASGSGRFEMSHTNELFFDAAGTIVTRGVIDLVAGQYDIEMVQFEGGGSFFYELTAASGTWLENTTPPGGFQLVGFVPPAATVVIPGIADPGWSVETAGPNAAFAASIAGADGRINAGATTSLWDTLNFWDPQDGSEGSFPSSNPWPLNTPAADDSYSMRATGTINITSAGTYHLGFQGDDGGYMYIYGAGGNPDPVISSIVYTNLPAAAAIGIAPGSSVNNAIRVDATTGNSRTIVAVPLLAGQYQIKTLVFEGGGGSWWEVVGAKAPLDPSFQIPLLARGAGTTVNLVNGLAVVAQSVTPPPANFKISGFTITGNPVTSAQFNFSSQDGATYTVQGSVDLTTWINVGTNVPATGTSTPFSVNLSSFPALSGKPKVFFRVVLN